MYLYSVLKTAFFSVRSRPPFMSPLTLRHKLPSHVFASHHLRGTAYLSGRALLFRAHALSLRLSASAPLCFLQPRKNLRLSVAHASSLFGIGCLSPSVGTCLRHLPPSLHPASVTPAPILFTICTQKTGQPKTVPPICIRVGSTRERKTKKEKSWRTTSPLKPSLIPEIH